MYLIDKIFAKFVIVGVINTAVGSAIMFFLYNTAHVSYWLSSAANYIVGSILSFFLNKYITFDVRHWSIRMVALFSANIIVSYLLAYGIAKPAVNYVLRNTPQHIRGNLALVTGMCLFTGLNYIGQRLVVFRKRQSSDCYSDFKEAIK